MSTVIGVDLGTSGLRAVLVSGDGAVRARASVPIAATLRRDPQCWWAALTEALTALPERRLARAIAIDATSGTILPVSREGYPLAPASLYNDAAPEAAVAAVAAEAPADSAARGATSPLARMLSWVGMRDLAFILHEADWLAGRLRGQSGWSDENNALKSGYEPRDGSWPLWLGRLGVTPFLPAVVPAGSPLGPVAHDVAQGLGLAPDCVVVAGTTDGCASFLATGASMEGDAVSALGSTLTIKLLSQRPLFAPNYGVYSHKVRGLWLAGGASNAGGAALAKIFPPERIAELSARIDPTVPTPHDFYPLPETGERFPRADPTLAPRLDPRPPDDAEYLAGLFEGLARIEAAAYRRLAELGGPAVSRVLSVGGAAANPVFTAIRARVLGIEVRRADRDEAAYGTALLALKGVP
jgi:sugar (pentulose or hexulose) kinase